MKLEIELTNEMLKALNDVQQVYSEDLQGNERVPTLAELVLDAVGESYIDDWTGLAKETPKNIT